MIAATKAKLLDHQSTLVVQATGTGKTVGFSKLAADFGGRALVLSHREELVQQSAATMRLMMPDEMIAVEQRDQTAIGSVTKQVMPEVRAVSASIQTIVKRLKSYAPERVDLVIVDECHHCVRANKSYTKVVDHFLNGNPNCKLLGVTATPDRLDELSLGQMFESVAYEYDVWDAIQAGWLVPISQKTVVCESFDFEGISNYMGDLSASQLDELLSEERPIHEMIEPTIRYAGDRSTLIFAAGVHQSKRMAEILNRHKPGSAESVDGKTPLETRRDIFRRFGNGSLQYLVNCQVATEGVDVPGVECVVMGRPTASRALYCQMSGRGSRVLPGVIESPPGGPGSPESSGNGFWRLNTPDERKAAIAASAKPELLIIDFADNARRHRLIHMGDVLGGNRFEDDQMADEIQAVIEEESGKSGEPIRVDAAMNLAKQRIEEKNCVARQQIVARVKSSIFTVDPFDHLEPVFKPEPQRLRDRQPSEKQRYALERNGFKIRWSQQQWNYFNPQRKKWQKLSFWRAMELMDAIGRRREAGHCTPRQAATLRKYGEDHNVSFSEASKIIDEISKSDWSPRDAVVEKTLAERIAAGRKKRKRGKAKRAVKPTSGMSRDGSTAGEGWCETDNRYASQKKLFREEAPF